MDPTTNLVAAARQYLGVPFRHQGRTRKGVDCVGLVVLACRSLGKNVDVSKNYGRQPDPSVLLAELRRHTTQVLRPEPGDIILLKFFKHPQHLAVYSGGSMIHSLETIGRVVEHRFDQVWQSRAVAYYRVNE